MVPKRRPQINQRMGSNDNDVPNPISILYAICPTSYSSRQYTPKGGGNFSLIFQRFKSEVPLVKGITDETVKKYIITRVRVGSVF